MQTHERVGAARMPNLAFRRIAVMTDPNVRWKILQLVVS